MVACSATRVSAEPLARCRHGPCAQAASSAEIEGVSGADASLAQAAVRREASTDKYSESSSYYKQAHAVDETILAQPQATIA